MTLGLKEIAVRKIYLDPDNPRHESLPDERAIIEYLIAKEKVRNLARNIAEAGSLSPLEPIAVIEHPKIKNAYTVVEGNRRICALKLLADPSKSGTEADRRYFATQAQGMIKSITRVQAIVFESRDAATRWFALRHRGEQDGVGAKAWEADQITRFNLRTNGRDPNAQALLLMEYAKARQLLPTQELSNLSISTLTRFLSTPVLRHAIGLADRNSIQINVPDAEFECALTRLLRDALDPQSDVHSRTSAADRKAYASRLAQEGVAAKTHARTAHDPGQTLATAAPDAPEPTTHPGTTHATTSDPSSAEGGTNAQRTQRHADRRRKVIQSGFTAKIDDKILRRLYRELKDIDAVEFTVAATALFRSVLEKSTSLYLTAKGITPDGKLDEKLKQLCRQLQAEGLTDRQLKFLRTIAQNGRDGDFSPDTLGHYIHGGATPTPSYVFKFWDNMEPILRRTLNQA